MIVAGVAVIGTAQTSLSSYFSIGSRETGGVAYVVTPQEIASWTPSAVSG